VAICRAIGAITSLISTLGILNNIYGGNTYDKA